eukprot:149740_1
MSDEGREDSEMSDKSPPRSLELDDLKMSLSDSEMEDLPPVLSLSSTPRSQQRFLAPPSPARTGASSRRFMSLHAIPEKHASGEHVNRSARRRQSLGATGLKKMLSRLHSDTTLPTEPQPGASVGKEQPILYRRSRSENNLLPAAVLDDAMLRLQKSRRLSFNSRAGTDQESDSELSDAAPIPLTRTLSNISLTDRRRSRMLSSLKDDVAVGLTIIEKANEAMSYRHGAPAFTELTPFREDERTCNAVLSDLILELSQHKPRSLSQMAQEIWDAKIQIFTLWLNAITDRVSQAHPSTAAAVEELRHAFSVLFSEGILDPEELTRDIKRRQSSTAIIQLDTEAHRPSKNILREIENYLRVGSVVWDLESNSMDIAVEVLLKDMVDHELLLDEVSENILDVVAPQFHEPEILFEQGRLAIVSVNYEVIGHDKTSLMGFCRLRRPILVGDDQLEVSFVVVWMASQREHQHTELVMQHFIRLMADRDFYKSCITADHRVDVIEALERFIGKTLLSNTSLAVEHHEGGLNAKGCFTGLAQDFRRRFPVYCSDFRDGIATKSILAVVAVFFANLGMLIAFGTLIAEETHEEIDVVDMILGSGVSMIFFALVGGQGLHIIGATGPVVIFIGALYEITDGLLNLPFRPVYAVVGLWAAFFLFICSIFNLSKYIRHLTRFTDDVFAALISVIFIFEPIKFLIYTYGHMSREVAAVTSLLLFCTIYLIYLMSTVGKSVYVSKLFRRLTASLSIILAIVIMSAIARLFVDQYEHVHTRDSILHNERGIIHFWKLDYWVIFIAIIPGFLTASLLYLEQNITSRILYNPENQLRKGTAYHWDMLILAIITVFVSLFGLPWVSAASFRTLQHFQSLAKHKNRKGYFARPEIIGVIETRLTAFIVGGLTLLILACYFIFELIPLGVIFGIFFYMGIQSLDGNQFVERIKYSLMDRKLVSVKGKSRIKNVTIYFFTGIQVVCFAILFAVKITAVSVFFPLFVIILIPLRSFLGQYVFSQHDLAILDTEGDTWNALL